MTVFEIYNGDFDDADGPSNGISNGTADQSFRKLQKNFTGFLIWRVENMNIVALPRDSYGTFLDSEAYIIYASSSYGTAASFDTVTREIKSTTEIHVHFWLGAHTSAEKSGVAAYKTVELDSHLGGSTIQHRETQGNESPRFKSYFKNGIKILKGNGNSRESNLTSGGKLFRVKGRRVPIVTQLSNIVWNQFNSGDVYLLQTPDVIFVWIGRAANAVEKLHSAKIATQMKEDTGIGNILFVDDGYEQTMPNQEKAIFQQYLPLDKRHVMPPHRDELDDEYEKVNRNLIKLYKCSDNMGKYRVTEVKTGPVMQNDLDSDDVFIIDHGVNGIWVWVGKRASDKERVEAMRNARGFVKKKKYPNNTRVTRLVEGAESMEFKMLFQMWRDKSEPTKGIKTAPVNNRVITKLDALTMAERPSLSAELQLVDDGSGALRVWRIHGTDAIEIAKEKHGQFFAGDCYIVWYTYKTTSIKNIIFYWMGSTANKRETDAVESKVQEIDQELDGIAVIVRLMQGKEPAQFLQLFKGKMIVYKGAGIDYDESGKNLKHPSSYLLQIEGSTSYTSKATQVNFKASSLNSNYCFVLKQRKKYYIWCGNCSTGDQREMAKHFTGKEFEIVLEGREPDEFWELLGGKAIYVTAKIPSLEGNLKRNARLFQCSTSTGTFRAEEVFNFTQSDLIPEDVMLLDAHECVFIWIGKLSSRAESKQSLELAKQYIKSDPAGRELNTPITTIRQGNEPPNFIGFFNPWSDKIWKNYKCFDDVRQELQGTEVIINKSLNNNIYSPDGFDKYDKYPISILKGPSDKLPSKVNPLVKELHLTHDDFVYIFKMTYGEFESLPRWKQQELKKKVGLF